MTAKIHIFVDNSRCEINGKSVGVTPLENDLRAAIPTEPTREIDKRGEVDGIPFDRKSVLYDDLGLSFCYNVGDSKVVWLMADFNRADWRQATEEDLGSNFEGVILIGRHTVNRTIRWSTYDDTVDATLQDISIQAASCDSGMLSGITIGFPKNEEPKSNRVPGNG